MNEIYDIGDNKLVYVKPSKYLLSVVVFDYYNASSKIRALFQSDKITSIYIENGATLHWLCQIPLKLLNPRIKSLSNISSCAICALRNFDQREVLSLKESCISMYI